jgi:hypothetical protein
MLASPPLPHLADLDALVDEALGTPAPQRSHDEIGDDLLHTRSLINRLELVFARDAARLLAATDFARDDDPTEWMRSECKMTSHTANTAIRVGTYEPRLHKSVDAFLEGRIGLAHLGLLAHTAECALGASNPPRVTSFDETKLLSLAERKTVYHFRRDCYDAEHAIDAAACVANAIDGVEGRRLRLEGGAEGGLAIFGYLDAEGGALLRTALEPLAKKSGPDEYRTREQRLGDALVELVAHVLDSGAIPQRASQRSHLQVTTTVETLQAISGAPGATLEYGGSIPDLTVQRLACDATITRVLINAESAVIDVGRSQRVVPPSTRRALNVRDRGCRWPGCDRPAPWTAAHHIVHWSHHGETNLANLVLLCHRHHWFVHECGHQIVRSDDGSILTIPPRPDFNMLPRPPT